ncbi:MAG: hypothetical protein HPY57_14565 [Ignavibacteria bacterium]|nr:hypothetical protein [Ignavibacteria bacterium]
MKLARFNNFDLNEAAKKSEKVELEKKILDFLKDELTKNKLSRADMIKKIENKFKDEKDISKICRDVIDDITHEPLSKKEKVESESFWIGTGADKYSAAFYFIGDKAKDPDGKEKNIKKERPALGPKKEKKEKIKKFDEFGKEVKEEKGAGLKRWREEQKKKKAEKGEKVEK